MKQKLDNLGAWRLLRRFKGDWRAAQDYTAKARGKDGPLFRGKKAWLRAAAAAEEELKAQALMSGADWLDRELQTNPRFRVLFPGVLTAQDMPPYLELSEEQRRAVMAAIQNRDRNLRQ